MGTGGLRDQAQAQGKARETELLLGPAHPITGPSSVQEEFMDRHDTQLQN